MAGEAKGNVWRGGRGSRRKGVKGEGEGEGGRRSERPPRVFRSRMKTQLGGGGGGDGGDGNGGG